MTWTSENLHRHYKLMFLKVWERPLNNLCMSIKQSAFCLKKNQMFKIRLWHVISLRFVASSQLKGDCLFFLTGYGNSGNKHTYSYLRITSNHYRMSAVAPCTIIARWFPILISVQVVMHTLFNGSLSHGVLSLNSAFKWWHHTETVL